MIKHLQNYIKKFSPNFKYIALSFCLLSSSLAILETGQGLYLIALMYIGIYSLQNTNKVNNKKDLYLFFLLSCILSCIINSVWDLRLLLFSLVLIVFTPILNSFKLFLFRQNLIYIFLLFFPILSIAALYCYFAGINLGTTLEDGSYHDFSAFFSISISLAAAVGISNVVITWLLIISRKRAIKLIFLMLLLSSIFISIVSASRSALVASILAILMLVYYSVKNIKQLLIYLTFIIGISIITYPFYSQYTNRLEQKFESGKNQKFGSRTDAWVSSYNQFKKTPIFGYGFAVTYHANTKSVGRGETGSGWLSILFQTGILGCIPIIILVTKALRTRRFIKKDKKLLLFYSIFIYLCLHSLFEGYILTSMLYMCLLFWLLLGYLHTYPMYLEKMKYNKQQTDKSKNIFLNKKYNSRIINKSFT